MPFFEQQLKARGMVSEHYCPTSIEDLASWVAVGLEYGQSVRAKQRDQLAYVWRSLGRDTVRSVCRLVMATVNRADSSDPRDLAAAIVEWQQETFNWVQPTWYGAALRLVVHFADFAIWAGWLGAVRNAHQAGSKNLSHSCPEGSP